MVVFGIVAVCLLAGGLGLFAYIYVISHQMSVVADVTAKAETVAAAKEQGVFPFIWAKVENWKTIILGWISAVAGIIATLPLDTLNSIPGLPWANVFDQKVAGAVTIVSSLLIPIVHAQGMKMAALTTPENKQAD